MKAMLRDDEGDVEEFLSYPASQIDWQWRDQAGATLMHHAARLGWVSVVQACKRNEPQTAEWFTHIGARPSLWTPLMCSCERTVHSTPEQEAQVLGGGGGPRSESQAG